MQGQCILKNKQNELKPRNHLGNGLGLHVFVFE